MADEISIIKLGPGGLTAYSGEHCSEIAFFRNNDWVVKPLPEFAQYHDGSDGDTAVYGWVPDELIDSFISEYRA